MNVPTDIDLVPGAACTSALLLFPFSLSMSEAVVDIGVADLEPVKSDSSSWKHGGRVYGNIYRWLLKVKGEDETLNEPMVQWRT